MKQLAKLFSISCLLALTGASCLSSTKSTSGALPNQTAEDGWQVLQAGLERRVYKSISSDTPYEITAYRLNTKLFQVNLRHSTTPKRLQDWHKEARAVLTINGAYFTEAMLPTGLFIDDGKIISDQAYDLDRSGTIVIENGFLHFATTLPTAKPGLDAFQSFPLLIKDAQPAVESESEKTARRTAIGVDRQNNLIILIVDKTPLSLYVLASILAASDLGLVQTINLDGGPSSGLLYDDGAFSESLLPLLELPLALTFSAVSPAAPNDQ